MAFTVEHTIGTDGIERIAYEPDTPRHETPIIMQHGMWHGAWCWRLWQEQLAAAGWRSVAHSLPGHGLSPVQRPIRWCTLGYYLRFLRAEIERQPMKPIVMGHSMGGALIHWSLRHYGSDFAAAVLVAPWPAHDLRPTIARVTRADPLSAFLGWLTLSSTPGVRTPAHAERLFLSEGALISAEELHSQLGPETGLAPLQHRPPFWEPAPSIALPMLIVGASEDQCINEAELPPTAHYYGADYFAVPDTNHDIMLERSGPETCARIAAWLDEQRLP